MAKDNFRDILSNKLNSINLPACLNCDDVHCQSRNHTENIEDYTLKIMEAMENAGIESLPVINSTKANRRPLISG